MYFNTNSKITVMIYLFPKDVPNLMLLHIFILINMFVSLEEKMLINILSFFMNII